ncbi:MAG: hypothetical protein MUC56_10035 [Thermoanaerobaculales bacterium]|jgi:hypothetical protein|nr:hypothetical protein [Thermoanaerobaculales bacterium]
MNHRHGLGLLPVGLMTTLVLPLAGAPSEAAIKELANDNFPGVGSVACQIGFVEGESAAAKLTADLGDYPYQIRKARMLICPASTSGFVILRIYEDNTGTVLPGPLLYEEIVQVTGSDAALNEVDLTLAGIVVPSGSVRVELEWFQDSPPGVAADIDGYFANVNYIFAVPGGWFYANQLGVLGDWIIRLEIETDAETPIFVDDFETGNTAAWSVTSP